jgi:hypothetical protein
VSTSTAARPWVPSKQPAPPLFASSLAPWPACCREPQQLPSSRQWMGALLCCAPTCADPPLASCSCEHGVRSSTATPLRFTVISNRYALSYSTSRRNFQHAGHIDEEGSPIAVRPVAYIYLPQGVRARASLHSLDPQSRHNWTPARSMALVSRPTPSPPLVALPILVASKSILGGDPSLCARIVVNYSGKAAALHLIGRHPLR